MGVGTGAARRGRRRRLPSPPLRPTTSPSVLRQVLRRLRRMSTALALLFALGTSSIVATLVPQRPVSPRTVAAWEEGSAGPGGGVARLLSALSLFDVFASWWFWALAVALLASLAACLTVRVRAALLAARRPVPWGPHLDRLSTSRTWHTDLAPDEILHRAHDVLRRRGYRTRARAGGQVAGERGRARELGSIAFHASVYVLLLGVGVAHLWGFSGQVDLTEGESFTDTRVSYGQVASGPAFGLDDHRGFTVELDDFSVDFHRDGSPSDFRTLAVIRSAADPGAVDEREIRLNHPARVDGMTLYVLRYGIAPRVVLRAPDGAPVFDAPVRLQAAEGGAWMGTAPVRTSGDDQMALQLALVPAGRSVRDDPHEGLVLLADLYEGPLNLGSAAEPDLLDWSPHLVGQAVVDEGASQLIGGGGDSAYELAYVDRPYWAGFQASHQPGRWLLLTGAGLLLAGLVPSLFAYRRRCWVEVEVCADSSQVTVAGVALHREDRFRTEFARIATELERAVPTGGRRREAVAHA